MHSMHAAHRLRKREIVKLCMHAGNANRVGLARRASVDLAPATALR